MQSELTWSDRFSLGFSVIDSQHQEFFRIINDFENVQEEETISPERLNDFLNELIRYMQYHFQFEESIMRKYRYPELDEHIGYHDSFRAQILIYTKDFREQRKGLAPELRRFMVNWLTTHILSRDQKFAEYMRRNYSEKMSDMNLS